jgi:two-component system response regulator
VEAKSMLVVEDNPDDEALTLRALKKNAIQNEVVVARDGIEALAYLLGTPRPDRMLANLPAVVLLDLKLPRVDGHEVLRRLRGDERTKLRPVFVLTFSKEEQDLVESYRLGANSYGRKPVNFARFVQAVRELALYWLILNERPPIRV